MDIEEAAREPHSPSSSRMLTVAMSGDPLMTPMAAAAGGTSRSRKNSSGHSANSSSRIGTLKLTVRASAGKVTLILLPL